MRALTLWRPWAGAVAHMGKPVENRSWFPPKHVRGEPIWGEVIAIHAGRTWDADAAEWMVAEGLATQDQVRWKAHPTGIVCVARLIGVANYITRTLLAFDQSRREECETAARSPWGDMDDYGWLLGDVVPLPEPVPCRGAQGLWRVPPAIERQVLEQVEVAS